VPDEVDPRILQRIITRHLPYEICMLQKAFVKLMKEGEDLQKSNKLVFDALHESFCIHARSLIDFFSPPDKRHESAAIASDFAPKFEASPDTRALSGKKDKLRRNLNELRDKLNKQVFHITTKRPENDEDQFDVGRDGGEILKAIETEIRSFDGKLAAGYKGMLPPGCLSETIDVSSRRPAGQTGPTGPGSRS
jgi:hypothetical protein